MWVGPWWLPEPHLTIPVVEDVAECGTVVEDGAEYGNRATVNIIVIVQRLPNHSPIFFQIISLGNTSHHDQETITITSTKQVCQRCKSNCKSM